MAYGKNREGNPWECISDDVRRSREVQWHYYNAVNYYFDVINNILSSLKFSQQLDKIFISAA